MNRIACESGGIGRRAGLRIQSRKGSGFESPLSHLPDAFLIPCAIACTCGAVKAAPWILRGTGVLLLVLWAAQRAGAAADEFARQAAALKATCAVEVEKLAAWCQSRGLTAQAAQTRNLLPPQDPYKLFVPVLPAEPNAAGPPPEAPPEVHEWHRRLVKLRQEQSLALWDLARKAVRARRTWLGYELLLEALRINPDLEPARRVLGYQKVRNGWYTSYEANKLRAGQIWDDRFGWIPKGATARYEQGWRLVGGRWLSPEEVKKPRPIQSGWDIETEHYLIRTNCGIDEAVALGTKLEQLCTVWQLLFIGYYATEADVAALFEGRGRISERPRMRVVYFADRQQYNDALRAAIPKIDITVGLYLDSMRAAYFFAAPDGDDRTLYHEATHQLFHESRPVARDVGRRANFWIIEGIALYMESLRRQGDYYVLGGVDDVRFYAAQYRLLNDGFYVPLSEVTAWGMDKIQQHEKIAVLYSQFAGLTYFLIHGEEGRYREALAAYLSAVYAGRDDPNTLAQLVGVGYSELDKQYRQFIAAAAKRAAVQDEKQHANSHTELKH